MDEILIEKLIDFVENASPYVWEVVQKQVFVYVLQCAIWCGIAAFVTMALVRHYKKANLEDKYRDDFDNVLEMICIGVTGFVALALFTHVVSFLANPDYYAIKKLTDFIK